MSQEEINFRRLDSGEKGVSPKLLTIQSPEDPNPKRTLSKSKRKQAKTKAPSNFFSNASSQEKLSEPLKIQKVSPKM